ncbi:serine/threonine-protein kinase [Mycolicibacterium llatzerense]|uniref:serine/threonine-protein kinase n=1 Tax=Mycolicibacterium llatzerense TaxID=280871 RepID=UPI0021B4EF8A|nr:serine/threonine-protein kinase [Mycolicibacterium llatzerense]MCT7372095.1 hypothetical protein [Mycolicibacterium llatzerense]
MDGDTITIDGKTWEIGARIGIGGAGVVHEALDQENLMDCAAKFVIGGHTSLRETEFEHLAGASHVMPILAIGDHKSTRVIVMPRAERSLRATVDEHPNGMPPDEVLPILIDIAIGLNQLKDAGVIHRDIAAGNILLYEGRWVLADFGIARNAAAVTSTHTHKNQHNPRYAAPEQWRLAKPTFQMDIYAFGITAYELLYGKPPFHASEEGEDSEINLKAAHCHEVVHLPGEPSLLSSLIEQCLAKAPYDRPAAADLLAALQQMAGPDAGAGPPVLSGAQRLFAAAQAEKCRREQIMALQMDGQRQTERYSARFKDAERQLIHISDEFVEAVSASLPMSAASPARLGSGRWRAELAMATLEFSTCLPAQHTGSPSPYTLVAGAEVSLRIPLRGGNYTGRSHSLWYADLHAEDELAWYELAFVPGPGRKAAQEKPYAVNPSWDNATVLLGDTTHYQVAWPVTVWRPGDLTAHIERWITWFGEAADGTLERPTSLERPVAGTWRHPAE